MLLTDSHGSGRSRSLPVADPLELAQPRGDPQEALDDGPEAVEEPRQEALGSRLHRSSLAQP